MRRPKEITHNGRSLRAILDDHRLWWWSSGGSGVRASLGGSYLDGVCLDHECLNLALLDGASMNGVSLNGTNMNGALLNFTALNGASLNDASLNGASLDNTLLNGASLVGTSLYGVRGNMREVKSAQFDRWPIAWTTAPDGIVTLQIGCQRHPFEMWEKADPLWIAALDPQANKWWAQYRDIVLNLVKSSPAVPYGLIP